MKNKILLSSCIISALLLTSTPTLAAHEALSNVEYSKVKVSIKDSLGGIWYILDKQDEGTPRERYIIQPSRQSDGSIIKHMNGWRMWIEQISPQSVKLSMKISNVDHVKTFKLEKTPTKKEQCETFSLGDKPNNSTVVCLSIPTSTNQKQGLW